MKKSEIDSRLKEIKIENYIWVIYIGIIILSFYSNSLEKKYFLDNDLQCLTKYREIMILIFSILIFVYFYFLSDSYKELEKLNNNNTKEKLLIIGSYIAALLIFISGVIFLLIAIFDENNNVEIAFN